MLRSKKVSYVFTIIFKCGCSFDVDIILSDDYVLDDYCLDVEITEYSLCMNCAEELTKYFSDSSIENEIEDIIFELVDYLLDNYQDMIEDCAEIRITNTDFVNYVIDDSIIPEVECL